MSAGITYVVNIECDSCGYTAYDNHLDFEPDGSDLLEMCWDVGGGGDVEVSGSYYEHLCEDCNNSVAICGWCEDGPLEWEGDGAYLWCEDVMLNTEHEDCVIEAHRSWGIRGICNYCGWRGGGGFYGSTHPIKPIVQLKVSA